jgi:hypothetical protein
MLILVHRLLARVFGGGAIFIFAMLLSGCATHELWDQETFAKAHYPASPADLRLQYSTERKDILVEYLDHRQDSVSNTRRRYWLYRNLEHQQHPKFVSPQPAIQMMEVPVYQQRKPAKDPKRPELYAVLLAEGGQFQLFSDEQDLGTFELPSWRDADTRVKQVLLTPFALVFDGVVIAVVVALVTSPYWGPALIEGAYR